MADWGILRTRHVLSTCRIKGELQLAELLSDPIITMRAASAGVTQDELRTLCERTAEHLRTKGQPEGSSSVEIKRHYSRDKSRL
jgi:hypothetical protein